MSFKVKEVRSKTVLADFNEPLAGIVVSMDFEVLALRDATKAENRRGNGATDEEEHRMWELKS